MRALSIRQPYAELILRGLKKIEYRSQPTHLIGEPFYIYAARKPANGPDGLDAFAALACELADLPTGLIVGTATIIKCTQSNGHYEWHLSEVKRLQHHRKPRNQPQPVWFKPF